MDGDILMALLKRSSPVTHRHLSRHGVEPTVFMIDWFMCVYTRTLSWNAVLRVWDMFFCEGFPPRTQHLDDCVRIRINRNFSRLYRFQFRPRLYLVNTFSACVTTALEMPSINPISPLIHMNLRCH